MTNKKPILVLIAGGTAAGKTTLAIKVAQCFPDIKSVVISTDDYIDVIKTGYLLNEKGGVTSQGHPTKSRFEILIEGEYGWAKAESVKWEQVVSEVKKELSQQRPKLIFLEGIHALQNEEIRKLAGLKIYSHTDEDIRLILKCQRSPWFKKMVGEESTDHRNFGGSVDNPLPFAFKAWWKAVKPSEAQWIIPTKQYANLILEYKNEEDFSKNTEKLVNWINLYFQDPKEFPQKLKELRVQGNEEEIIVKELKNQVLELQKQLKEEKEKNLVISKELEELKLQNKVEIIPK